VMLDLLPVCGVDSVSWWHILNLDQIIFALAMDDVLWVDSSPVPNRQRESQNGVYHGDGLLGACHARDTADVEHTQRGYQ
jgi:hypothetical protein